MIFGFQQKQVTMKKYIASILVMLFVQQVSATNFYEQLVEFNFNWAKYKEQAPNGEARNFDSDKDYVQAHLSSVIPILRSNPVDHLNEEQYTSRLHLIEVLDGYRIAGKFPINYYREERIPVFIDEHDTHCAVGYLLQQTGNEVVAQRISNADNYAWVKDINDPALPAWQEASGFSLEELKLIQGAYDFYQPDAFIAPNKYEIPQQPKAMIAYFENKRDKRLMPKTPENVWCHGEGKYGVLDGKWEQNYAVGIPWIEGYYSKGKRSGQWKEYYQGTNKLCRTENWRNDKLNGVRKRFDRAGVLIEEIMFKDGKAISKTNYDLRGSLKWIRKPIDSTLMWTEVYTFGGGLIAYGHEKVHNPGNLLWFQNIELTALNSASITSRDASVSYQARGKGSSISLLGGGNLYQSPPLVEYKKEGDWVFYKEHQNGTITKSTNPLLNMFSRDYKHFGNTLYQAVHLFDELKVEAGYDSIRVAYKNNMPYDFYGFGEDYAHLQIRYYDAAVTGLVTNQFIYLNERQRVRNNTRPLQVKEIGQYNKDHLKIGTWKHYDTRNMLYKTEQFIIPWKEEEMVEVSRDMQDVTKR
jgi:antitoxin component YwqK of YwqJK toxin-antitoxin module